MIDGINGQGVNPGMTEESMAASLAMVVNGFDKKLKPKVKIDSQENRPDLKTVEDYVQKLVDSVAIDKVKKYDGKDSNQKKQQEEDPKNGSRRSSSFSAKPFEWKEPVKDKGFFS